MQNFWLWFSTGITHITDLTGYDHILFLMVLCVPYSFKQSKHLLWLITAFTIGHSISLAISVLGIFSSNTAAVEWLIALSILILAVQNISNFGPNQGASKWVNYGLTTLFGLIHGLGFSTLLRAMLGKTESLAFPLFSFNLGIEVGQGNHSHLHFKHHCLLDNLAETKSKIHHLKLFNSCIGSIAIYAHR
jgi:hydrogenase/urease accessory protein HupE